MPLIIFILYFWNVAPNNFPSNIINIDFHIKKTRMKQLPRCSLRTDLQYQIFTRPQTAKLYSYKKLTQILQGKYMSIQNKMPSCLIPKNSDQKRRNNTSQTNTRPSKKPKNRNPSIDNISKNKQKDAIFGLFQFERLKKEESRSQKKIGAKQNQVIFVPYAKQQQNYVTVSEPSIPSIPFKTFNKNQGRKRTQYKDKENKDDGCLETQETIQSWKNGEEDGMHFSSLFKKSWKF